MGRSVRWSEELSFRANHRRVFYSWSILNVSTVHLNVICHLISQPVLGGHPVLSGHYSIPRGCPLNTGITVLNFSRGNHNTSENNQEPLKQLIIFPHLTRAKYRQTVLQQNSRFLPINRHMETFLSRLIQDLGCTPAAEKETWSPAVHTTMSLSWSEFSIIFHLAR